MEIHLRKRTLETSGRKYKPENTFGNCKVATYSSNKYKSEIQIKQIQIEQYTMEKLQFWKRQIGITHRQIQFGNTHRTTLTVNRQIKTNRTFETTNTNRE